MHPSIIAAQDDHGLVMRRDVVATGGDDRDLVVAVREEVLVKLRPGTFCDAKTWVAADERAKHLLLLRGVMTKARADVVASHVSAVAVHGAPLWDLPTGVVHLTRRDQRGGRKEAGVVQHRGALLDAEVVTVDGITTTSPARTVIDLACLGDVDVEHVLPVADDLLRRGLLGVEDLKAAHDRAKDWPGSRATQMVVRLADGRRESVGESRTAFLMWAYGVPYALPQVDIHDADGRHLGRVDFAWPELGVWLEFDGKEKYSKRRREGESVTDAVLREKKREERIARATGWRCIRITWADLYAPRATAAYINRVLQGGPVHR